VSFIERFPEPPGLTRNHEAFLKHVKDVYVTDAYHSLSNEGYKVTPDLIEREVEPGIPNRMERTGSIVMHWQREAIGSPIRQW